MGESVTEGTVAKWLKQVGETVRQGEGLVEVTTDKVDAEVPAPMSGRLLKILANTGDTIAVGSPLAELSVGDGDGASAQAAAPLAAPSPPPAGTPLPPPAPGSSSRATRRRSAPAAPGCCPGS